MFVTITKGHDRDHIRCLRDDGSVCETTFGKKGPLPHDAIHLIVESEVGLNWGFWGLVAAGVTPDDVAEMAKTGGHASASRASIPDPNIVQLLQAERLVECFEAVSWSAPVDHDQFRAMVQTACAASHVTPPPLSDDVIASVNDQILALALGWTSAESGYAVERSWPT
jgi:hypothetical protein